MIIPTSAQSDSVLATIGSKFLVYHYEHAEHYSGRAQRDDACT